MVNNTATRSETGADAELIASIPKSFAIAGKQVAARRARLGALIESHADVCGFSKLDLGGDVFWSNGRKNLTTGQLLETLGTKLVKAGIVAESEFYA